MATLSLGVGPPEIVLVPVGAVIPGGLDDDVSVQMGTPSVSTEIVPVGIDAVIRGGLDDEL
jgi:hypothetical protein